MVIQRWMRVAFRAAHFTIAMLFRIGLRGAVVALIIRRCITAWLKKTRAVIKEAVRIRRRLMIVPSSTMRVRRMVQVCAVVP